MSKAINLRQPKAAALADLFGCKKTGRRFSTKVWRNGHTRVATVNGKEVALMILIANLILSPLRRCMDSVKVPPLGMASRALHLYRSEVNFKNVIWQGRNKLIDDATWHRILL